MAKPRFGADQTTDQKRLARGEHLLLARRFLRRRDEVHHAPWRILMLAGGSPEGEINAIREVMPKARITAVDYNPSCLEAAIAAGVDDVIHCDLLDWTYSPGGRSKYPNSAIALAGPFDLVNLDLCGTVNRDTRDVFRVYKRVLARDGVMVCSFSYGRDVTEVFEGLASSQLLDIGVQEPLADRLVYLFDTAQIQSIVAYRGSAMPMATVLLHGRRQYERVGDDWQMSPPSFLQLEHGDFELAVVYPDAARLYDCPQERIESLRRSFAAIKATLTRKAMEAAS